MILGKLNCGVCGIVVNECDEVVLSDFNTIVHSLCYYQLDEAQKDRGRFKDILSKHDYLQPTFMSFIMRKKDRF